MRNEITRRLRELNTRHSRLSHWYKVVTVLAAVVVFCTTYALIIPAITMERELICGLEEHVHTDECWGGEELVLTCGLEETEGHHHTDECYEEELTLICEDESEEHTHTDECYESIRYLVCGQEEFEGHTHGDTCYTAQPVLTCGLKEHTHTDECYAAGPSDDEADVETREEWEATMADVELTDDWAENVLNIALSQLGYEESTRNYIIDENGSRKGYTRYGDWYGIPYGDWCAMYAAFVLNYAGVPYEDMPYHCGVNPWIEMLKEKELWHDGLTEDYIPMPGDLVFFDYNSYTDESERVADHVGILMETVDETEWSGPRYRIICGNNSNNDVSVSEYALDSDYILGFGELPANPDYVGLKIVTRHDLENERSILTAKAYGFEPQDFEWQWQISSDDREWYDIDGATGLTYVIDGQSELGDVYYYRLVATEIPDPEAEETERPAAANEEKSTDAIQFIDLGEAEPAPAEQENTDTAATEDQSAPAQEAVAEGAALAEEAETEQMSAVEPESEQEAETEETAAEADPQIAGEVDAAAEAEPALYVATLSAPQTNLLTMEASEENDADVAGAETGAETGTIEETDALIATAPEADAETPSAVEAEAANSENAILPEPESEENENTEEETEEDNEPLIFTSAALAARAPKKAPVQPLAATAADEANGWWVPVTSTEQLNESDIYLFVQKSRSDGDEKGKERRMLGIGSKDGESRYKSDGAEVTISPDGARSVSVKIGSSTVTDTSTDYIWRLKKQENGWEVRSGKVEDAYLSLDSDHKNSDSIISTENASVFIFEYDTGYYNEKKMADGWYFYTEKDSNDNYYMPCWYLWDAVYWRFREDYKTSLTGGGSSSMKDGSKPIYPFEIYRWQHKVEETTYLDPIPAAAKERNPAANYSYEWRLVTNTSQLSSSETYAIALQGENGVTKALGLGTHDSERENSYHTLQNEVTIAQITGSTTNYSINLTSGDPADLALEANQSYQWSLHPAENGGWYLKNDAGYLLELTADTAEGKNLLTNEEGFATPVTASALASGNATVKAGSLDLKTVLGYTGSKDSLKFYKRVAVPDTNTDYRWLRVTSTDEWDDGGTYALVAQRGSSYYALASVENLTGENSMRLAQTTRVNMSSEDNNGKTYYSFVTSDTEALSLADGPNRWKWGITHSANSTRVDMETSDKTTGYTIHSLLTDYYVELNWYGNDNGTSRFLTSNKNYATANAMRFDSSGHVLLSNIYTYSGSDTSYYLQLDSYNTISCLTGEGYDAIYLYQLKNFNEDDDKLITGTVEYQQWVRVNDLTELEAAVAGDANGTGKYLIVGVNGSNRYAMRHVGTGNVSAQQVTRSAGADNSHFVFTTTSVDPVDLIATSMQGSQWRFQRYNTNTTVGRYDIVNLGTNYHIDVSETSLMYSRVYSEGYLPTVSFNGGYVNISYGTVNTVRFVNNAFSKGDGASGTNNIELYRLDTVNILADNLGTTKQIDYLGDNSTVEWDNPDTTLDDNLDTNRTENVNNYRLYLSVDLSKLANAEEKLTNVTLTDELTEYVQLLDGANRDVKVTLGGTTLVEGTGDGQYSFEVSNKTVTMTYHGELGAESGVLTVSYNISTTAYARNIGVSGYNGRGGAKTDYPNNATSSAKRGFYANKSALFSYTLVNGEANRDYHRIFARPVVQVPGASTVEDVYELKHVKYIDAFRDGIDNPDTNIDNLAGMDERANMYRIYLEVDAQASYKPADLIFVVDRSNSMRYSMANNELPASGEPSRGDVVSALLNGGSGSSGLISTFLSLHKDNQVAVVSFQGTSLPGATEAGYIPGVTYRDSSTQLLGWTNAEGWAADRTAVNCGGLADNGSDYSAGLLAAADLFNAQKDNGHRKIMIFMSDGAATYATSYIGEGLEEQSVRYGNGEGYNDTLGDQITKVMQNKIAADVILYTVGIGPGTDTAIALQNLITAHGSGKAYSSSDMAALTADLSEIISTESGTYGNLVLSDELSDYVDFAGDKTDVRMTLQNVDLGLEFDIYYIDDKGNEYYHKGAEVDPNTPVQYVKTGGVEIAGKKITFTADPAVILNGHWKLKVSYNVVGTDDLRTLYFTENAQTDDDTRYKNAGDTKLYANSAEYKASNPADANNTEATEGTDYPGNETSAGKAGVFANAVQLAEIGGATRVVTKGTLSYTRAGTAYELPFVNHPVVQWSKEAQSFRGNIDDEEYPLPHNKYVDWLGDNYARDDEMLYEIQSTDGSARTGVFIGTKDELKATLKEGEEITRFESAVTVTTNAETGVTARTLPSDYSQFYNNPDTTVDDKLTLDNAADLNDWYRIYLEVSPDVTNDPIDVVFVVDESSSMAAQDVVYNDDTMMTRIDFVNYLLNGSADGKTVTDSGLIDQFLKMNKSNNIAVVGFSTRGGVSRTRLGNEAQSVQNATWTINNVGGRISTESNSVYYSGAYDADLAPVYEYEGTEKAAGTNAHVVLPWTSGKEWTETPGTTDRTYIKMQRSGATDLSAGLIQAAELFRQLKGNGHRKMLMVVSDGAPTFAVDVDSSQYKDRLPDPTDELKTYFGTNTDTGSFTVYEHVFKVDQLTMKAIELFRKEFINDELPRTEQMNIISVGIGNTETFTKDFLQALQYGVVAGEKEVVKDVTIQRTWTGEGWRQSSSDSLESYTTTKLAGKVAVAGDVVVTTEAQKLQDKLESVVTNGTGFYRYLAITDKLSDYVRFAGTSGSKMDLRMTLQTDSLIESNLRQLLHENDKDTLADCLKLLAEAGDSSTNDARINKKLAGFGMELDTQIDALNITPRQLLQSVNGNWNKTDDLDTLVIGEGVTFGNFIDSIVAGQISYLKGLYSKENYEAAKAGMPYTDSVSGKTGYFTYIDFETGTAILYEQDAASATDEDKHVYVAPDLTLDPTEFVASKSAITVNYRNGLLELIANPTIKLSGTYNLIVSFNVQLTPKAHDDIKAASYVNTGDSNTDYPADREIPLRPDYYDSLNPTDPEKAAIDLKISSARKKNAELEPYRQNTSSDQPGFLANDYARLYYKRGSTYYSTLFPQPVVQATVTESPGDPDYAIPHFKRIDAFGDGASNPDTDLESKYAGLDELNDYYRIYLTAAPAALYPDTDFVIAIDTTSTPVSVSLPTYLCDKDGNPIDSTGGVPLIDTLLYSYWSSDSGTPGADGKYADAKQSTGLLDSIFTISAKNRVAIVKFDSCDAVGNSCSAVGVGKPVTFYGSNWATNRISGDTTLITSAESRIDVSNKFVKDNANFPWGANGTNYMAAFKAMTTLFDGAAMNGSPNKQVIIFITDKQPSFWTDDNGNVQGRDRAEKNPDGTWKRSGDAENGNLMPDDAYDGWQSDAAAATMNAFESIRAEHPDVVVHGLYLGPLTYGDAETTVEESFTNPATLQEQIMLALAAGGRPYPNNYLTTAYKSEDYVLWYMANKTGGQFPDDGEVIILSASAALSLASQAQQFATSTGTDGFGYICMTNDVTNPADIAKLLTGTDAERYAILATLEPDQQAAIVAALTQLATTAGTASAMQNIAFSAIENDLTAIVTGGVGRYGALEIRDVLSEYLEFADQIDLTMTLESAQDENYKFTIFGGNGYPHQDENGNVDFYLAMPDEEGNLPANSKDAIAYIAMATEESDSTYFKLRDDIAKAVMLAGSENNAAHPSYAAAVATKQTVETVKVAYKDLLDAYEAKDVNRDNAAYAIMIASAMHINEAYSLSELVTMSQNMAGDIAALNALNAQTLQDDTTKAQIAALQAKLQANYRSFPELGKTDMIQYIQSITVDPVTGTVTLTANPEIKLAGAWNLVVSFNVHLKTEAQRKYIASEEEVKKLYEADNRPNPGENPTSEKRADLWTTWSNLTMDAAQNNFQRRFLYYRDKYLDQGYTKDQWLNETDDKLDDETGYRNNARDIFNDYLMPHSGEWASLTDAMKAKLIYPAVGDIDTDYGSNKTSSEKDGFLSNAEDPTYKTGDSSTLPKSYLRYTRNSSTPYYLSFKHPVVQVTPKYNTYVTVTKNWGKVEPSEWKESTVVFMVKDTSATDEGGNTITNWRILKSVKLNAGNNYSATYDYHVEARAGYNSDLYIYEVGDETHTSTWLATYRTESGENLGVGQETNTAGNAGNISAYNMQPVNQTFYTVQIKALPLYELPKSGGEGTVNTTVSGAALVVLAAGILILRSQRRKRERRVASSKV